jgi:hypothetical protein
MLDSLEKLVNEVSALHSKLILLISGPQSGKSALLEALGSKRNLTPLRVGAELGSKLAALPQRRRQLQTTLILRELVDQHAKDNLLLIDNIELLFDRTLQLDPLDLLKQHARVRRVVAVWPGQLNEGRLTYAATGHPEHQDYATDGVVPFAI